jgi:hypothetical protein
VSREGRASPDAVRHDAGGGWAAGSAGQALDKANRLPRLNYITLGADRNQDCICANHADGCREIAEASRVGDEDRMPVGQDRQEIGEAVLIWLGIAGHLWAGIGGGCPSMGAAIRVGIQ